jgi:hypothetical protein
MVIDTHMALEALDAEVDRLVFAFILELNF